MSAHPNNIRRTFAVRCITPDEHGYLERGGRYTVIGDDGVMFQIRDRYGNLGKFDRKRFERIVSEPSKPKRRRIRPAKPVQCVVVEDGHMLKYDPSEKVLVLDEQEHSVFPSKRAAKKAIWHTVHGVEWVDGYDPKEAASHYEIVPHGN